MIEPVRPPACGNSPLVDEATASAPRHRWCWGRDHEEDSSSGEARTIVDMMAMRGSDSSGLAR
jgi:hypothetical protein